MNRFRLKASIVFVIILLLFWYPIFKAFQKSNFFRVLKELFSEWYKALVTCAKAFKAGEKV